MKNILNKIRENKNVLLVIGGVGTATAGAFMMKKASLKCDAIIQEHKETADRIELCIEEFDDYTEEDAVQDTLINNINTVKELAKVYIIPASTVIVGGCMIINGVLNHLHNRETIDVEESEVIE